jgi:Mg2+ and Co2+ transporter CorA
MLKTSILKHLSQAHQSHISWMKSANKSISSSINNQNSTPFDATECSLGVWLNYEGKALRKIKTLNKIIERIEIEHNKLHNIYLNIYQIFFMLPKQKSFLEKLFNFYSKTENEEVQEAVKLHFKDIEEDSKRLIELLKELERRIDSLPFDKIDIKTKKPFKRAV